MGDEDHRIGLRRAYEPPTAADGRRVRVDRVWPRGVTKDELRLDDGLKAVAPSTGLRKWFGHDPAKWAAFKRRYFDELDAQEEAVRHLLVLCEEGPLTLVFAAKDEQHNNAVALRDYLLRRLGER